MNVDNGEKQRILLVDDQPDTLWILREQLTRTGCESVIARSGQEALQHAERFLPDLILLDVDMPGMDGFETCRRLKANQVTAEIPVIFLTAFSETNNIIKGFEMGGVDYLSKSARAAELVVRITTHLTIRKLQQSLQTHNDFLHQIIDSFSYPFYVIDANDYSITLANAAAGVSDGLAAHRTCYEWIHQRTTPCNGTDCPCSIEVLKRTKHPIILEHVHLDREGHTRHIEIHASPILNSEGQLVRVLEYMLDITERTRVEKELQRYHEQLYDLVAERTRELDQRNEQLQQEIEQHQLTEQALKVSEARYRALYEDAPVAYLSVAPDRSIMQCNPAASQLLGYTHEELLQMQTPNLYADVPEGIPKAAGLFQRFLAGEQIQDEELQIPKQDGSLLWVSLTVRPIKNEGGEIIEARAMLVDITVRKRQELHEKAQLEQENLTLFAMLREYPNLGRIIGKSPLMQEIYQVIVKAAASKMTVLLCGESGTGKELVARTIHRLSARKDQPFVAVNCGAVSESVFEREFFGYRKGAFTGAISDKPGYFDQAHRGTLFLDEIGELPPALQVTLLRALETGEYIPVGDTISKTADVRIIAATNQDLKAQLHSGAIRQDFFYRISVLVIALPPLRERREDIPLLIEHFLTQYADGEEPSSLPDHLREALYAYHWPGNVRELQNEIQRYLMQQRPEFIGNMRNAPLPAAPDLPDIQAGFRYREALEAFEKQYFLRMLAHNHGHRENTARMLDIPIRTFQRKIKKLGII